MARKTRNVTVTFTGLDGMTRTHMRRVLKRLGCADSREHAKALARNGASATCKQVHKGA